MKITKTQRMITSRVAAAIKAGRPVVVDGTRIQDIRFNDGEIEVDWWGSEIPEGTWTAIQPCFLSGSDDEIRDGKLELNTYW